MWKTIGQDKAIALIEGSLKTDNLAHAYLFVGPEHIGKTTLALDLARAVNCQGENKPCTQCQSCTRISNGKHADIIMLSLDSPDIPGDDKERTKIGIKKIHYLQNSASLPPYEGKLKIFIIDDAEHLSNEAANCLLKTLEEPPPKVLILLLASDESQLLPTVVSRCQRLELTPASFTDIEEMLLHSVGIDKEKAKLLSRLSRGCPGWAIGTIANDDYLAERAEKLAQMSSLLSEDWGQRLLYISQLRPDRKSAEEQIRFWLDWWHDLMLAKCGCQQAIMNTDQMSTLKRWTQALSLFEIKDFIHVLKRSLAQIAVNANPRLILECLMLDMPIKPL
ncbi:MAG: DNA polymerase III subunit delta' [Chloroflexi bacterium]|nr:DNA polymerase III subunit delta' [Chloroflexota bacterium]MBM3182435.1 DNA polymerase III subunit delta' [Chloroflexota bacterium]MBM4451324.1 DNA polymerase III subunit delta' [Chloroflexota bacterium]MBM4453531.1 DNA polymerase III subunit delta' [Chloroflexota bacterium]